MKNLSFLKSLFFLAVSMSLVFFSSCGKEEVATPETFENEFGKFTKEITISDESGENTAVLRVGSDDKSILDMWQPENYRLVPIMEGQTLAEVMEATNTTEEETLEEVLEEDSDDDLVAGETSTMIVSKNLKPGVRNVALTIIPPSNEDLRGWSYATHYSAIGANEQTCNVFGHNIWHRGYYGLQYKAHSYSGWSTVVSEWRRIRNNEAQSHTKNPCYQMKARRKYKSGSVTIEFEY